MDREAPGPFRFSSKSERTGLRRYDLKGKIKLTVVSAIGKEAIIAILNPPDFFGEGCLAGQPIRMGTATAMTDCEFIRIECNAMQKALQRESRLSALLWHTC